MAAAPQRDIVMVRSQNMLIKRLITQCIVYIVYCVYSVYTDAAKNMEIKRLSFLGPACTIHRWCQNSQEHHQLTEVVIC